MKAILFDADGVLALSDERFSQVYARTRGIDPGPFEQFFKNAWKPIVIGKKDLKESIAENPDLWQWDKSVDELLEFWFEAEDVRNEELLKVIRDLKSAGISCYLATDQDHYRGEYMKNVMFKDQFDDHFISADLGVGKTDPRFFEIVIERLQKDDPDLQPNDIVFFDDSQSKVDSAKSSGIDARLYTSVDQVRELLG